MTSSFFKKLTQTALLAVSASTLMMASPLSVRAEVECSCTDKCMQSCEKGDSKGCKCESGCSKGKSCKHEKCEHHEHHDKKATDTPKK
jgi:hypothetical protein